MNHGFVRVAAAVPELKVADCLYNALKMAELIKAADDAGAQIVVFPELSLTGYSCGDLFHQQALLKSAREQLGGLLEVSASADTVIIAGVPLAVDNQLFNCAAVFQKGRLLGTVPKTYIPGYKEFYEERWFASGVKALSRSLQLLDQVVPFGTDLLFEARGEYDVCFGIEICEDLWVPIPPSSHQALGGAALLFNLSASNELIGKAGYRRELVRQQSARCVAGYVYASAGVYESSTDIVYGGHSLIAENGGILAESERFERSGRLTVADIDIQRLQNDRFKNTSFMEAVPTPDFRKEVFTMAAGRPGELKRWMDPHPFVPSDEAARDERCGEIFAIQTAGLAKKLSQAGLKNAVIGISGGLDSTLALLVTAKTFDLLGLPRENITAVTMPGFGTTDLTYTNAVKLIEAIKAGFREINITAACLQHFADIGHDPSVHDVTYENVQARERTQILMDMANKQRGLVVGTGDLSELALGWCTYNGDHMSMYGVNCSIPKTLVKYLVRWAADNVAEKKTADILYSILDTPITPELLPPDENGGISQRTEDIVGPYELHDFFLYHMIRYGASPGKILFMAGQAFKQAYGRDEIKKWLRVFYKRFFSQQFKRSCLPDGPKVGTISLSPRGDWRMPSDAEASVWLEELG